MGSPELTPSSDKSPFTKRQVLAFAYLALGLGVVSGVGMTGLTYEYLGLEARARRRLEGEIVQLEEVNRLLREKAKWADLRNPCDRAVVQSFDHARGIMRDSVEKIVALVEGVCAEEGMNCPEDDMGNLSLDMLSKISDAVLFCPDEEAWVTVDLEDDDRNVVAMALTSTASPRYRAQFFLSPDSAYDPSCDRLWVSVHEAWHSLGYGIEEDHDLGTDWIYRSGAVVRAACFGGELY